jgi:hypothetical protein
VSLSTEKFWPKVAMWLALALSQFGCRSADDIEFSDQAPTYKESLNSSPVPESGGSGNSTNQPNNSSNGFGSGQDITNEPDIDINYPVLSFTGRGNLDHRNGSANVVQKISASMNKSELRVTVQQFAAESGDNTSDVNEQISSQTGDTVYQRETVPVSTSNLAPSQDASFLIFTRAFEDRRGGGSKMFAVTSGDALPVLVIPAAESRYESLSVSSMQFQSQLNAPGGKSFSIRATISGVKMSAGNYQVTIEYYIPEDRFGELHGLLPFARSSDYGIDLSARRISSISTRGLYKDSDNDRSRAINIAFQLCQSVKDGKLEQINICP